MVKGHLPILPLLLIGIFVVLLLWQRNSTKIGNVSLTNYPSPTPSSEGSYTVSSPLPSPTPTPSPIVARVSPTPVATHAMVQNSSSPGPSPTSSSSGSSFQYPGAKVVSSSGNNLSLESSDDSAKITAWYKDTIAKMSFSVKSTVTTTTNGKVLNKLAAAKNGQKVEIEITKESGESITHIKVSFSNS